MSEEEKQVVIPSELFNSIVDYLSQKPFAEVHLLMTEIQQTARMVAVKEEESDDES